MKIMSLVLKKTKNFSQRVADTFTFYFKLGFGITTLFYFIETLLSVIDRIK